MNVAIIPARGGSKRIPRKNIKEFCGKPMIAWSIEAALQSSCFEQVIVSTDDPEIAEIARSYGAMTPFTRPPELSDDHSSTAEVVRHAIEWIKCRHIHPSAICCIYATAPFIIADDIKNSLSLLIEGECDYALPVTTFPFPIQRALRLKENHFLKMMTPQFFRSRSQDLEEAYHDAGQFCWGATNAWLEGKPVFDAKALALIIPRYRVQDIDTEEDWQRAELLFKALGSAE